MPSNVINTKDIPAHASKRAARQSKLARRRARKLATSKKAYEELTPAEKKRLQKEVFIRLNLIADS